MNTLDYLIKHIDEIPESDLFNDLSSVEKESNRIIVSIANEIMRKRESLQLTQKEFAARLGVSQSMVSQWESGDANYSVAKLVEIMVALGFSIDIKYSPIVDSSSDYVSTSKCDYKPAGSMGEIIPFPGVNIDYDERMEN